MKYEGEKWREILESMGKDKKKTNSFVLDHRRHCSDTSIVTGKYENRQKYINERDSMDDERET